MRLPRVSLGHLAAIAALRTLGKKDAAAVIATRSGTAALRCDSSVRSPVPQDIWLSWR